MNWINCSSFVVLTGHCLPLLLETCGHAGSYQRIPWYVVCGGGLVHKLLVGLALVYVYLGKLCLDTSTEK